MFIEEVSTILEPLGGSGGPRGDVGTSLLGLDPPVEEASQT